MNKAQWIVNSQDNNFTSQLLVQVCRQSSVINRALDNYGQLSLAEYLCQILRYSENPLQPRNDLLEVIYHYAESLLGETVAENVVLELEAMPVVLTANHHGVDFLAQSVQGSLIFSLREVTGKPAMTVPVFACGNVALNNPTFPRGLLIYNFDLQAAHAKLPIRLPIFLDRDKRKSVSTVDAFDYNMVIRAEQRLKILVRDKQISPSLAEIASTILSEDYRSVSNMGLSNYSQQAVALNNRIWKKCFQEPEQAPELVYLELEKITSLLLQLDLNDENSLIWQVMFNPNLRVNVLGYLDGAKACWNRSKLASRIAQTLRDKQSVQGGSGTVFFWGVDDTGCRIPLALSDSAYGEATLQGRDEQSKLWTIPFKPKTILQALQVGRILPSLFTCYTTIGFARGVSCCGGYFQCEYLPIMQHGLIRALQDLGGCASVADCLSTVPSDIYLSGMQMIMHHLDDDVLLPAGPIEIISSGGLSQHQINQLCSLRVCDVHLAGLVETVSDMYHQLSCPDNWCYLLANENSQMLRNKTVVIKSNEEHFHENHN